MIVYGDPATIDILGSAARRLIELAANCRESFSLDDLRLFLVRAGQLEQAIEDGAVDPKTRQAVRSITDFAADALLARWQSPDVSCLAHLLNQAENALRTLVESEIVIVLKIPEGFAFYCLYPEAYLQTAIDWSRDTLSENDSRVTVIGVRSIGTSLSAVVCSALKSTGVNARRFTIRPTGHPFERETELPSDFVGDQTWCLIVDEGPGLSGSSLAGVAQAASNRGQDPTRTVFFPGHSGFPGDQASKKTRNWWNSTARRFTPTDSLKWEGLSLIETLKLETESILDQPVVKIEDFSGGAWRKYVYSSENRWPWSAASFENVKFRISANDGEAILWKFVGCNEERRSGSEFTILPVRSRLGFAGIPWKNGGPLAATDASASLVKSMAQHISACAGEKLSGREAEGANHRLLGMAEANVQEALGEEALSQLKVCLSNLPIGTGSKRYGDGRMAPWEWIRTDEGDLFKVDSLGHDADHTVVGVQPFLWDVAGVLVEWELDQDLESCFIAQLEESGFQVEHEHLAHYSLSYAAFRMGLSAFCVDQASDPEEHRRGTLAFSKYRNYLLGLFELRSQHES